MKIYFKCISKTINFEYELAGIIKVIDRLYKYCDTYIFSINRHPCDIFEFLSIPQVREEEHLDDEDSIFYDAAMGLYRISTEELQSESYEGVANVVPCPYENGDKDDTYYKLKPEYANLLKSDLSELKSIFVKDLNDIKKENEIKRNKKESRRQELMKNVQSVDTRSKNVKDEGGYTTEYYTTVRFNNGEEYEFAERNIFDFGAVINPCYKIAENQNVSGGLPISENGIWYWQDFDKEKNGWYKVREIMGRELQAFCLVNEFGKLVDSEIRM